MSLILIADDNPHARRLADQILRPEGYLIAIAGARESLPDAAAQQPAIVLADAGADAAAAVETCRRIRATAGLEQVPLLLTASPRPGVDRRALLEAGASRVLDKPLDAATLLAAVREFAAAGPRPDLEGAVPEDPLAERARRTPRPRPSEIGRDDVRAAVRAALETALPALTEAITDRILLRLRTR